MKQVMKQWPLFLTLLCLSEFQNVAIAEDTDKVTDDIFYVTPVEAKPDYYTITEGKLCKKNGEIQPCSFDVSESSGNVRIVCKDGDSKSGAARSLLLKDNSFYFNPETKGFVFKECGGEFKILFAMKTESVPNYESVMFTPKNEEKLKQSKDQWVFQLGDAGNKANYIAKYEEQKTKDAMEKQQKEIDSKKQRIEDEKRLAAIKKNWIKKNYQGSELNYSKKNALLISAYLGMMNWYDASMNCRNQGMRLPTLDEMESLSANSLCAITAESCVMPIWTSTSRRNDKDVQRNALVGNGAWTWAEANGQGLPSELHTTFGVLCVK